MNKFTSPRKWRVSVDRSHLWVPKSHLRAARWGEQG